TGRTDPGENPGATDDTIHRSVNGGVAMTLTRPQGGISAARTRAVLATAAPGRGARHGGWTVASAALFAVLGLLMPALPAAAAIVITGGPSAPAGSWSCTAPAAGSEKLAGGGNYTCSGTAGAFSNLYLGINSNTGLPFGDKMNSAAGSEPSGAERFVWSVNGTNTIRYTGQTAMSSGGPATVFTRVTLTFSGTGSIVDDATTQALTGTNINGSVHALWRIDPTVSSLTVNVLIEASTAAGGPFSPADVFFGTTSTHRSGTGSTDQDKSHVDLAFYTSSCGDGTPDTNFSREQCDQGSAVNGTAGSCCTSSCQFKGAGITCRASAGQCDVAETCTGSSATCPADGFASSATTCTGASQGGVCDNDPGDHCLGTANTCVDSFKSSATVCRGSAGQCDLAETCTGSSGACPADTFAPSSTTCTGASQGGACDND